MRLCIDGARSYQRSEKRADLNQLVYIPVL
jgi:hypothetical protein